VTLVNNTVSRLTLDRVSGLWEASLFVFSFFKYRVIIVSHVSVLFYYLNKRSPARRHGGVWGERRYSSYSFSTSALDGGEWSASRPGRAFTPGTHCTGGWVGPRSGLDTEARGKILCPRRGSNPDRPVVQPVVRHYTA
jgi:hypothetical protein